MFWIFIIAIIGIFLYTKYNRDKEQLHNKIASRGGMRELFSPFLLAAESDFGPANVTKATDTELEFLSKVNSTQYIYWGIKMGFSSIASFKADIKRDATHINAISVVQGGIKDQLESYNMLIFDLMRNNAIKV